MSITVPYSIELGMNEDAKNAVEGTLPVNVPGKMKLYLGPNVDPHKMQQVVGALKNCYRIFKTVHGSNTNPGTKMAHGHWQTASSGNINISATAPAPTADSVLIVTGNNFFTGRSHMMEETFKQLINVLLEKTKDN